MADLVVQYSDETGEPFLQLGQNILRLEREEISGEFLEKSRDELRETPENYETAMAELRSLLHGEKNFNMPEDDDSFMLKFMRPCKFYPKSAFKIMKKFYRFKEKHPKYSLNLTPKSVERCYTDEIITFLPVRTPEGCRVMVLNIGNWVPKELPITTFIRGIFIALEIAMSEPRTQVGGVQVIFDLSGLSLSHITQFNPSLAKIILHVVQECLALRLKGVHIVNQLGIFKIIYAVFKPFLADKLKKRLYFHGTNYEGLKTHIPPHCLPERYGGTLTSPDCPGELLYQILQFYEKEYEEVNTYGYRTEKVKIDE